MLTWRTAAGTALAAVILLLLTAHTLALPGLRVDQTTIGLLIMMMAALLLPDLTRLVGPGGWEVDFQRSIAEAERGLIQAVPLAAEQRSGDSAAAGGTDRTPAPQLRWPTDAGLHLAHLRVAIEDSLRQLADSDDGEPLPAVLDRLMRQHRLSPGMQRALTAFIRASDAYFESRRRLVPASVTRAIAVGEELRRRLTAGPGRV